MNQILVKVRNISKTDDGQQTVLYGVEDVITYKAYKHTKSLYELLYQCDENGDQVFDEKGNANPNLSALDQSAAQVKSAAPVVKTGPEVEVKIPEQVQVSAPVRERMKPGPKPKQELQEHTR